ncbi:hypothetical protein M9H77_18363 [Catharanthus roseus]|uniref:Uncharacterized protein n=1 Tax=Catharanthus roseus TaxID=4058 RepID=A0ACC0B787_CATRO|nr:hypothetical protein M9H77_18363 [Catharanthus roseus]
MISKKVILFKNPIMTSFLSHFTPRNASLIEINTASHLLNPKWKWLGRGESPLLEGTPRNRSVGYKGYGTNDYLGPTLRLVNIYMFRCNNNVLFVTKSFVGWFIGLILFMKLKETSKMEEIRVNGKEKTKDELDFHSTERL